MNLETLRAQFRIDADDVSTPPLWSDEEVDYWFNEAEEEAAQRANLLYEADNTTVCQIAVTAGTRTYPLDPRVIDIAHARFVPTADTTNVVVLGHTDRLELDRLDPRWRERTETPRSLVQDDTTVTLVPRPDADGVLHIECHRLPLEPMVADADTPEISAAHHRYLVHWVLHRAFSKPDSETIDPERAGKAEKQFEARFGRRLDADMRRSYRADRPHHNISHW